MPGYKQIIRFLDSLTVELSRHSVARALLFRKERDIRKRSALMICSTFSSRFNEFFLLDLGIRCEKA